MYLQERQHNDFREEDSDAYQIDDGEGEVCTCWKSHLPDIISKQHI